jgi:hypothetical protein
VTGSLTVWAPAAFAQPPPAATMVSPSSAVTTTTPTYIWNAAGSGATLATFYRLHVRSASGPVIDQAYSAAQARCAAGRRCSITPATALAQGAYSWNVVAYNPAGWGPWGRWLAFQVGGKPPQATLVAPSGTINDPLPTYIWNAAGSGVTRATWYVLRVQTEFNVPGRDRVVVDERIAAADAGCGGAAARECRTRGRTGGPGSHSWYIQACNAAGCTWSEPLGFVRR